MRLFVAFFSFIILCITAVLIPVAYFGDKNESATNRLMIGAGIAAVVFLIAVFW